MFRFFALFVLIFGVSTPGLAQVEFSRRYGITTSGALIFTGDTLGMNKAAS